MKNSLKKLESGIGKLAYKLTETNVNSACYLFLYQPKLPEGAKKLRKF